MTADTLVTPDGEVRLGLFDTPPMRINGTDYDYRTPMGRRHGSLARRLHYKQFQYFGVLSGPVLAGCALAHTGYLGLAFVYAYDTATGRLTGETFRLPLGRGLRMSDSPADGESVLHARGAEIRMTYGRNAGGEGEKTLRVRTAGGLVIDAAMPEPAPFRPLAICTRTGINGWTFANKVAGVPVSGRIVTPETTWDLATACGHHDFSAGYMRRETFWNWACLSGRTVAGGRTRMLGLNLSCGVNETSFSENCLWVDGQLIPTGLTRFDYDRRDTRRPWRITTADGSVNLRFTPAGAHTERMNLLLFATDFKQLFGRFDGTIAVDGTALPVDGLWGFVEEQYAKW
ncbi:MAG: DUF2804 domain-containing protein [Pseudomonadota bacterium]